MNAMSSCVGSGLGSEDVTILEITCEVCPQLPLRILGLFAQRNLIADHFVCRRSDDVLTISLAAPGLTATSGEIIAAKISGMIGVLNVRLKWALSKQMHPIDD